MRSRAAVTRDGLQGGRPGRQARVWSENRGQDAQPPTEPASRSEDRPASYYGRPIIKAPVWEEREIAGYLFLGGLAGASSLLAAGAQLTGRDQLAMRSSVCASGAIGLSLAALIKDLGRPARFINMLRVLKPSSPMSVGTWILAGYAPLNFASSASHLSGRLPHLGRAAGLGACALAPAVATYTAALFADTAVPAWHGGRRELPFVFAGSAASAAAGFGLIAAPRHEQAPARRMAVAGAVLELTAERLMERRLGIVAEAMQHGAAGDRIKRAQLLSAGGTLGAATLASRSRIAAAASGAALLAGSALTRFGIFAAGTSSAQDPRYTVAPQRARLEQQRSA
jgi:formate-dependent nitrite reductase membrane component NrfD